MYRITLLPPIVNKASQVIFLVTGKEKAGVLKKVMQGPFNPDEFPAQIIKPLDGELHWFVDEEAATLL
jgi:6-phosphogluconolactonase